MLTPLDKGSHMGLSLDEIASSDPKWMERFQKDYLNVRFPGTALLPVAARCTVRAHPSGGVA